MEKRERVVVTCEKLYILFLPLSKENGIFLCYVSSRTARNLEGEQNVCFENTFEKCKGSLYPHCIAISETGREEESNKCFAREMRFCVMYCCGDIW